MSRARFTVQNVGKHFFLNEAHIFWKKMKLKFLFDEQTVSLLVHTRGLGGSNFLDYKIVSLLVLTRNPGGSHFFDEKIVSLLVHT